MNKYIKNIYYIKIFTYYNSFVYHLKNLPVIRKYLKNYSYQCTKLKKIIGFLVLIGQAVGIILIKLLCIAIFVIFATRWFAAKKNLVIYDYTDYYFQVTFFWFCYLGAFQESRTFLRNKVRYICVHLIKMPIKNSVLAFLINEYIFQFLIIIIVFSIYSRLWLHDCYKSVCLCVIYFFMQLFSECIHMEFFYKRKNRLEDKKGFSCFLLVSAFVGAFAPILVSDKLLFSTYLISISTILICFIGILLCLFYIKHYKGYSSVLAAVYKKESLAEEIQRKKINTNKVFEEQSDLIQKSEKFKGLLLLDHLFFLRNKKNIEKYLKRRIYLLIALLIIFLFMLLNNYNYGQRVLHKIYLFTPLIPLLICQYAYGEGYCKFYYLNCDSVFMTYDFYRTKRSIIKTYFIKLKRIVKYNFFLGIGLCCVLTILFKVANVNIINGRNLLFLITIMSLIISFGIQHVSIYYLLQPYVKESTFQNPFMFMTQVPLIMLTYVFMFLKLDSIVLSFILIIGSIIYSIILLGLVTLKSSSTFTLK